VVLGFGNGNAPAAAWIAVRGSLDPRILILTAAVVFWGAGFDILYACQDYDHDCSSDVYSVPKAFGIPTALGIARLFHVITVLLLAWMVVAFGLGKIAVVGVIFVALLLIYEHSLVRHDDLSRVNAAFFTVNGLVSMAFLFFHRGGLAAGEMNVERIVGQSPIANGPICVVDRVFGFARGGIYVQFSLL